MGLTAENESEFQVTAFDIRLIFFRIVMPNGSDFTGRTNQEYASRGETSCGYTLYYLL